MFYSSFIKTAFKKETFEAKNMSNVVINLFYLRYFFGKMAFSVRKCQFLAV